MIPADAIAVRPYRHDTDQAFIYSTWLRNYKHSSYFAKRIKPAIFFAGHHKLVDHILSKPTTTTLIAHPRNDEDTILGYMVCEALSTPVVHFVFVKEAFRKMGVARALLKASGMSVERLAFSHWTYPVDELIQKYPDLIYNPYAL